MHEGDCLDLLHRVADNSIDLIPCDLPYEMTANVADVQVPLFDHFRVQIGGKIKMLSPGGFANLIVSKEKFTLLDDKARPGLWSHYKRILKPNGAIVLFCKGRFMADLINNDPLMFKYEVIWNKQLVSGQLNAKRMPMAQHEMFLVFTKSLDKYTYNPQMKEGPPLHGKGTSHMTKDAKNQNYGKVRPIEDTRKGATEKYPTSIWTHGKPHPSVALHRTEKPVSLLTEICLTYSNEGDLVLDNCAGSMGVGIACIDTNRKYILMEKDPEEFKKGKARMISHYDVTMDRLRQ